MALINTYRFTKTVFNWEVFSKATGNKYCVVCYKKYEKQGGKLPNGFTMTLTVLEDNLDYGTEEDGTPRYNNVNQTFDVTVLSDKIPVKRGDIIRLHDFDKENSYVIPKKYSTNIILRFRSLEILKQA